MNPRVFLVLTLAVFVLLPVATATSACPANDPNIGPYNKITILPLGYKLVGEEFTIQAVRVEKKVETPISGRSVKIYYFQDGTRKTLMETGSLNSKGEYDYTPTQLGRYQVETAGKAPLFDVKKLYDQPTDFGAVCGNGICEEDKLETRENCPDDCTVCGDAICQGNEDKENCPDDCIICGDGVCDDAEYWPGGCSCTIDCIICGDDFCDASYGENSTGCPQDCEDEVIQGPTIDILGEYWWLIVIIVIVGAVYILREKLLDVVDKIKRRGKRKKRTKKKKIKEEKGVVEEDEDIHEIILELMDTGISEKNIKKKLKEFGVEADEAERLIGKAKKSL